MDFVVPLVIFVIMLLVAAFPTSAGPNSGQYGPSLTAGIVLVLVLILMLAARIWAPNL